MKRKLADFSENGFENAIDPQGSAAPPRLGPGRKVRAWTERRPRGAGWTTRGWCGVVRGEAIVTLRAAVRRAAVLVLVLLGADTQ